MRLENTILATLLLACVLCMGAALAQDTPPPEQAGSEPLDTGLVEREVVAVAEIRILVTDEAGRPVSDLRPEEIRVFESGDEQNLAFLETVAGSRVSPTGGPAARSPGTVYADDGIHRPGDAIDVLPPKAVRRVVIAFDVRNSKKKVREAWREAAMEWITGGVQPEDQVGLVVFGNYPEWVVEFTGDRETVRSALESLQLKTAAADRDRRRDIMRLTRDIRACQQADAGRVASGDSWSCAYSLAFGYVHTWQADSQESVLNLRSLVGQLAAIPGRKAVLLFSEGPIDDASLIAVYTLVTSFGASNINLDELRARFNKNVHEELSDVHRMSRAGDVAFFTLDTKPGTGAILTDNLEQASGVAPILVADDPWKQVGRSTTQALSELAASTGGRSYHGIDDLADSVRSAADSFFGMYTVGYYRSDPDAKVGKVRVEIDRPDLEVDYTRRADLRRHEPAAVRLELAIGRPSPVEGNDLQTLPIRLMMAMDVLPLRDAGDSVGTVLGLHVEAISPDGSVVAERLDVETIAVGRGQVGALEGKSFLHETDLVLPLGSYRIRARVSDDLQALVADRVIDLTLERGEVGAGLAVTVPDGPPN